MRSSENGKRKSSERCKETNSSNKGWELAHLHKLEKKEEVGESVEQRVFSKGKSW